MKSYKQFIRESKRDIHSICDEYGINDYTVNPDGSIDVDGSVILSYVFERGETKIPLKFAKVIGDFECDRNQLTTLKGSPKSVGGNFECSGNKLTSLEYCPESVGGNFDCDRNQLTTLKGSPKSVGGNFYCHSNQLTSLEGLPEIGGYINCHSNQLITLKGSPKSVGGNFDCYGNKLTSLEYGPESVGGNFDCHSNQLTSLEGLPEIGGYLNCRHNQITDFRGVPEFFEGYFYCEGNPIEEIYTLFLQEDSINDSKCIKWINEFDVIQGNKVIMDRLEEVFHQLGMEVPEKIELQSYEII